VTVSVVLRLSSSALRAGELAGEAEIVETGARAIVRSADDLLRFLRRNEGPDGRRAGADNERGREDLR
jgi:hypothetical protein